jgi:SAM-dependent methyltransferase
MKHVDLWKPGKFVRKRGRLRASRDKRNVSVSSRLHADLIAAFYDANIPAHVRGRLIDLGCGYVPLYAAFKDYAEEIVCVDWGGSEEKNPFVDHEQDLNLPLNFAGRSFDTVILSDVLEHIRYPELLLQEIYRILDHNGKALLNVPFYYWIHAQPYDYFRYTEFALRSMTENAGFKILLLEAYGGAPEILADIHAKVLSGLPLIGNTLAICMQRMAWFFRKTKTGKRLSARSAKHFPFGYGMILEKCPKN